HVAEPFHGLRRRTALFVGSGVFAACAVTLLIFFVLGSNSSVGRQRLVASMDHRAMPQEVSTSWQTAWTPITEEPTPPPTEYAPTDTDVQAPADPPSEAEAAPEQSEVEPGHPGPPPPNPPPGPSEPPGYDDSGQAIQQ